MTQQECRATVQSCRGRIRKAKAKVELNLSRNVKGNKQGFYKYVNIKKMTRENVGPLLNATGEDSKYHSSLREGKKKDLGNYRLVSLTSVPAGEKSSCKAFPNI